MTLYFILNRMYEEMSGVRFPQLLQVLLLRQSDLIYEERSWKQQVRKLLQLPLGLWYTVGTLAFGILIAVLFDIYVSSSVNPPLIGWIARVVADIFVLVLCTITIAVVVFRTSY